MKIKPKFLVREITSENGERTSGGAPYTDKLAAMVSASLWKRDTGKDCRVYDASMNCVYDTSITGNELELANVV
jgi:hypothetical protein